MSATPSYAGRRVLVTGAAGYIGSELLPALLAERCEVTAVVRSEGALRPESVPGGGNLQVRVGDVERAEAWKEWVAATDVIFHLAGQTSHYVANENPLLDWQRNVAPLYHLYAACQAQHLRPRVVFPSTASVYGLTHDLPVAEDAPLQPLTAYDVHKLSAEHCIAYHALSEGIPGVSLRLANVYGASGGTSKRDRGFMNKLCALSLRGAEIQVYGTGEYLRDYVHILDVVQALLRAGGVPEERVSGQAFNIATGVGTSLRDAIGMAIEAGAELGGRRAPLRQVAPEHISPIDQRQFIGNHGRFTQATGWQPTVTLRQGIEAMVTALHREAGQ